jgi:hypothetical protein
MFTYDRGLAMHRSLPFFVALVLAMFVHDLMQRILSLPRTIGDWGATGSDDPRVVVAASHSLLHGRPAYAGYTIKPLTGCPRCHLMPWS